MLAPPAPFRTSIHDFGHTDTAVLYATRAIRKFAAVATSSSRPPSICTTLNVCSFVPFFFGWFFLNLQSAAHD
jgi:hypothetical protein